MPQFSSSSSEHDLLWLLVVLLHIHIYLLRHLRRLRRLRQRRLGLLEGGPLPRLPAPAARQQCAGAGAGAGEEAVGGGGGGGGGRGQLEAVGVVVVRQVLLDLTIEK